MIKSTSYALKKATFLIALLSSSAAIAQPEQSTSVEVLEKRLAELEASLATLRAELAERQAAPVPNSAGPPFASGPNAKPAPSGGIGTTLGSTNVKLSGFVKLDLIADRFSRGETALNAAGRDIFLPWTIPVGNGAPGSIDFQAHVKQTRFVLNSFTPLGNKTLETHIETDFQTSPGFQGTERTTNGFNLALHRAFITYGDFTLGQDWSNFGYLPTMPETADLIGPTEGAIFIRQAQIRWRLPLSNKLTLFTSLENPETASATPESAALIENRDDSLPDLAAKLVLAVPLGEFALSGLARQLTADGAGFSSKAAAWGVNVGAKIPFGQGGRNDLRLSATVGEGIGRYVGVNFAPDAILVPSETGFELEPIRIKAGFAAVRWFWAKGLRSTVSLSVQDVDAPDAIAAADLSDLAWSGAINLFYSPVDGLNFGIEYRHAEREVFSGASGALDRTHFTVKRTF
jgi:hypothetical protein